MSLQEVRQAPEGRDLEEYRGEQIEGDGGERNGDSSVWRGDVGLQGGRWW